MQDRRKQNKAKPWIVRWRVDSQQRTRVRRSLATSRAQRGLVSLWHKRLHWSGGTPGVMRVTVLHAPAAAVRTIAGYDAGAAAYDTDRDEPPGRWWGRGARALDVRGDVDSQEPELIATPGTPGPGTRSDVVRPEVGPGVRRHVLDAAAGVGSDATRAQDLGWTVLTRVGTASTPSTIPSRCVATLVALRRALPAVTMQERRSAWRSPTPPCHGARSQPRTATARHTRNATVAAEHQHAARNSCSSRSSSPAPSDTPRHARRRCTAEPTARSPNHADAPHHIGWSLHDQRAERQMCVRAAALSPARGPLP